MLQNFFYAQQLNINPWLSRWFISHCLQTVRISITRAFSFILVCISNLHIRNLVAANTVCVGNVLRISAGFFSFLYYIFNRVIHRMYVGLLQTYKHISVDNRLLLLRILCIFVYVVYNVHVGYFSTLRRQKKPTLIFVSRLSNSVV